MAIHYLKKASKTAEADTASIAGTVASMLAEIENRGESSALDYARKLDGYDGPIEISSADIKAAADQLPAKLKADIQFAHGNIRRFAEAQKATLHETEIEIVPGLMAGQKLIACNAAGCYVPGGRYSHIASAMMTVTTAKVAGCRHISVCSPPRPGVGVHPAIIYTANLAGADRIYAIGGVQAIAAMTFGYFGMPKADILVGPGNQYVAEAKRILFGRVGIDMFAGPTDSLIIADETADPSIVAADLIGQAEHGYNSPVWLITNSRELGSRVMEIAPDLISRLPEPNQSSAAAAWRDFAEIAVCDTREEMAQLADDYAPEHLSVQAAELDWWHARLRCYGSLFLGEQTTVAYGDKASGPNHVLPTSGAARYTGGLSVHKFIKIVTWQRATREGARPIAEATARISRMEGMEGHARSADVRLSKYFPRENFDLSPGE